MNIVERVARTTDAEGAYSEWYDGTSAKTPIESTTRQKYFRAKYECDAVAILKVALEMDPESIRADLVKFEVSGWGRLGIPIEDPALRKIIEDKYATQRREP